MCFSLIVEKAGEVFIESEPSGADIMQGEGELTKDGKTLNWEYVVNCPREQKPVTLRQVETVTGPKTKTLEMFGKDPQSGDEFKMMDIEFTKK